MSLDTLVETKKFDVSVIDLILAAAIEPDMNGGCPKYRLALDEAIDKQPPKFCAIGYADTYKLASQSTHWMASSLVTGAEREGEGAERLWSMAASSPNEEEKALLKQHAIDESKHSLMYLALLDLVFPNAVEPDFREELKQLSPQYSSKQSPEQIEGNPYNRLPELDDYIQMNIAEMRTTVHHLMQREALDIHCRPENVPKLRGLLDALLVDELSHVRYTAEVIEQGLEGGRKDEIHALFSKRMGDFNKITEVEVGDYIYD